MINKNFYERLIQNIPDTKILSVQICLHTVIVRTVENTGLSSIAGTGIVDPPRNFGHLEDLSLRELAQYYLSDNYLEIAIGMAAINAHYNNAKVLESDPRVCNDFNSHHLITKEGKGKNVAILGGFPFIDRLRDQFEVKNLWVFELTPFKDYHLSIDKYPEYLPQADIVLMTGTTLLNHTFHEVVKYLDHSYNVMTGPTTPMNLDFFEGKIHMLAGTVVTDYDLAIKALSQGSACKDADGLRKLSLSTTFNLGN